jgi:hypothetical protein
MTLEQPSEAPQRYLIHGAYPKYLFEKMDKIWISCKATEDAAADRKELHRRSRLYRDLEMTTAKHLDRGDYESEVCCLAMALAKIFCIPCIRYEAWLRVTSMEFVHSGVWFGLP